MIILQHRENVEHMYIQKGNVAMTAVCNAYIQMYIAKLKHVVTRPEQVY